MIYVEMRKKYLGLEAGGKVESSQTIWRSVSLLEFSSVLSSPRMVTSISLCFCGQRDQ